MREGADQNGRLTRIDMEANMRTVLNARIRQTGMSEADAKLPWMGCHAGRAIAKEPDAADLWQDIKTIRQRRRAWLSVIDAPDEFPAISSIKPESDYTGDEVESVDYRDDTEKARAAEAAWSAVANALFAENPLLLRYVEMAIVRDEEVRGPSIASVLRLPALRKAIGR